MLRWRLIVGTLAVAGLAGLCWLDHRAPVAGIWLGPLAGVLATLAAQELLALVAAAGIRPQPAVVYSGTILILASNWFGLALGDPSWPAATQPFTGRELAHFSARSGPERDSPVFAAFAAKVGTVPVNGYAAAGHGSLACAFSAPCIALAVAVAVAFAAEMRRFERPGKALAPLAATTLALVYIGLMLSFAVQLRLVFGVAALVSLLLVVKLADTGAYAVGRLLGRHKLAPVLSPGKTWEGAAGALAMALAGAWISAALVVPALPPPHQITGRPSPWWGWIAYACVLALLGMLGDLAESLLKREAGRKDSSTWLPGLGGVLDMLDSILLAAPAAYLFWALGLVGRQ